MFLVTYYGIVKREIFFSWKGLFCPFQRGTCIAFYPVLYDRWEINFLNNYSNISKRYTGKERASFECCSEFQKVVERYIKEFWARTVWHLETWILTLSCVSPLWMSDLLTTNCRRYVGARPLMDFTIREHPWLQSFELIEAWQYLPYLSLLKLKNKAENWKQYCTHSTH